MKVSVIWSSPNESELTNSAAKQFMKGLANAGVEVNDIWLNKKKMQHCNGFDMYY